MHDRRIAGPYRTVGCCWVDALLRVHAASAHGEQDRLPAVDRGRRRGRRTAFGSGVWRRRAPRCKIWFDVVVVEKVLDEIDAYCDAVPRSAATVEAHGPFTLFIGSGPWPYYARPARRYLGSITVDDVDMVRARQRDLDVPEAFEWIGEVSPLVAAVVERSGLVVGAHPLMVLTAPADRAVPPAGVSVRLVDGDGDDLAALQAVQSLAFQDLGTAIGGAGLDALAVERQRIAATSVDFLAHRLRAGVTVMAAAFDATQHPLAVGMHNPLSPVTELVGVATLPALRRRGLAAAVTAVLIADAQRRDVDTVFLSAADDAVAHMYQAVGFTTVATAYIAHAGS
jgi:ribosomal protein S18 acetylase RimI-like enzyme